MFHVEHFQFSQICFSQKFGAGAPVRSQYNFDHVTQKRMTKRLGAVIVYFQQSCKSFFILAPTSACAKVTIFPYVLLAPIIQ